MAIVINSTTGEIDLNATTPAIYEVTYTTNGSCPTTVKNTITVNALDGATFGYSASSLAQTGTASLTTTPTTSGGVYSAYPSGLSINSSTGEIDLANSTIQSYKIFYETSGAGCPNSSTFDLAVTAAGIANNYSMNFDSASSDYIDAGVIQELRNATAATFSCWLYRDNTPEQLFGVNISSTNRLGLEIKSTNQLRFHVNTVRAEVDNFITSNGWYHIVITYDGSKSTAERIKVYRDGQNTALTNSPSIPATFADLNTSFKIGTFTSLYLEGKLDELAIWDTALTDGTGGTVNQIAEIYNATSTNLTKDLTTVSGSNLVYWNRMGD